MALSSNLIEALAAELDTAALERRSITKVTDRQPLSMPEAYDLEGALRARRLKAGASLSGLKMGLTSRAKMKQMKVEAPIYGYLLDEYQVPSDADVSIAKLIHPRIEPEIALVTSRELRGPGCTIAQALAAIDFVVPAFEVIDSRYTDFKFDLPSVVADNASSARYIVGGSALKAEGLDLRTMGVVVDRNGESVSFGAGAAVLGHPAWSLAMLANLLSERNVAVPAGTFVMTGGITEAIAIKPGDHFTVRLQGLGALSARFVN